MHVMMTTTTMVLLMMMMMMMMMMAIKGFKKKKQVLDVGRVGKLRAETSRLLRKLIKNWIIITKFRM